MHTWYPCAMCTLCRRHGSVEKWIEGDGYAADLDRHQGLLGELHLTVGHGDQPLLKLYVLSPRDEELIDFVAARWRRTTTATPRTCADEYKMMS